MRMYNNINRSRFVLRNSWDPPWPVWGRQAAADHPGQAFAEDVRRGQGHLWGVGDLGIPRDSTKIALESWSSLLKCKGGCFFCFFLKDLLSDHLWIRLVVKQLVCPVQFFFRSPLDRGVHGENDDGPVGSVKAFFCSAVTEWMASWVFWPAWRQGGRAAGCVRLWFQVGFSGSVGVFAWQGQFCSGTNFYFTSLSGFNLSSGTLGKFHRTLNFGKWHIASHSCKDGWHMRLTNQRITIRWPEFFAAATAAIKPEEPFQDPERSTVT